MCDQDCLVGDWGDWSHPTEIPKDSAKTIWEETVGGALQVQRVRSIIMAPSDGDLTKCPARVEYRPWKDHCVMTQDNEHSTRDCDTSVCTAGTDSVRCRHHADRCDDKAYARVTVSYHKSYTCAEVGWTQKTCDDNWDALTGKSLVDAECAVENNANNVGSEISRQDARNKQIDGADPTEDPGNSEYYQYLDKCGNGKWGTVLDGMVRASDAAECQEACVGHSRCQAWTYNSKANKCFRLSGDFKTEAVLARAAKQTDKWVQSFQSGTC
jgi:hypothetical protein